MNYFHIKLGVFKKNEINFLHWKVTKRDITVYPEIVRAVFFLLFLGKTFVVHNEPCE